MITSIDDVEIAVQCMRVGAFNYLVKPVNCSRFGIEVNRALEFWELRHENIRLRESVLEQQIYHPEAFTEIVTHSLFEKILKKSETIEAEVGANAEIGIPAWIIAIIAKVFASFKISTETREELRRTMERYISELIEKVNALLDEARAQVKKHEKCDLLFIMDSLDSLKAGLDRSLFLLEGEQLKGLHGYFIYVVPISLLHDAQASLLPFDEQLILPMIPTWNRSPRTCSWSCSS
ncbi:helix-turn-helix, Fis-type [Candidatus Vecturithrix granuli]|uniref:Helix-turn-helix, Fis-type n=1 Tax=Vecturithrix granuli TaxID=1499967 RepID=A0A081C3B8_VECG1|nr:helix-turn-helix, Fis-type [Candidatus Vecturithrix granuli]